MNAAGEHFFHSDPKEFRDLILLVARERRLIESAVEKDYWVTHALWGLHELGLTIWFKGGTCLLKGFGVIPRFSEDLDLKVAGERLPHVRDWKNSDKQSKVQERSEFFHAVEEIFEIPDMRISRLELLDQAKGLKLKAAYPIQHEGAALMLPFVQLEIGAARVEPFDKLDLASWVHDFVEGQGYLDEYVDNRPKKVRCVRPEVTVLDKLDAIQGKFARREPADFIRHYSDVAQIIQWLDDQGVSYETIRQLAYEMRRERDVRRDAFNPEHRAFNPVDDDRWRTLRAEHLNLDILYWDERPDLDEACRKLRDFIVETGIDTLADD